MTKQDEAKQKQAVDMEREVQAQEMKEVIPRGPAAVLTHYLVQAGVSYSSPPAAKQSGSRPQSSTQHAHGQGHAAHSGSAGKRPTEAAPVAPAAQSSDGSAVGPHTRTGS